MTSSCACHIPIQYKVEKRFPLALKSREIQWLHWGQNAQSICGMCMPLLDHSVETSRSPSVQLNTFDFPLPASLHRKHPKGTLWMTLTLKAYIVYPNKDQMKTKLDYFSALSLSFHIRKGQCSTWDRSLSLPCLTFYLYSINFKNSSRLFYLEECTQNINV